MMPANDIESDAANWLIRLEADSSAVTRSEFEAWLAADPRHQAAFIRMQRTWTHADIVKRLKPLDGAVDEQVIEKFGERSLVAEMPVQTRPSRTGWLALAASVAIVTLGAAAWILLARSGWQVYQTEFGGFQRAVLADGSTALLNTDSRIRVRFSSNRREVVLEKGEALFTVARDARRPFDVAAADTVVRAVGTAFSVRLREHQQVDVLVTEGRVAIDAKDDAIDSKLPKPVVPATVPTLTAGESTSVAAHKPLKVHKIADEDLTRKLAWTQGRIWFDRVSLADAVAEFNRYNRRQLVIDDSSIAGQRIGGTFLATDLDSFIAALQTFGIHAIAPANQSAGAGPETILLVGSEAGADPKP